MSLTRLIPDAWRELLTATTETPSFEALGHFVDGAYACNTVYPRRECIFRALDLTPPDAVRCVILGQDPYHGAGQAEGLCFSVPAGIRFPPSLRNIFKELGTDLGQPLPSSGSLERWGRQGVLLLNAVLTVEEGHAGAHAGKGWETFTDAVIAAVNRAAVHPVVFILWGNYAGRKRGLIDGDRHHIISSVHPSPLSARRGFFGSRPFSRANQCLVSSGLPPVDWSLDHQQELDFG